MSLKEVQYFLATIYTNSEIRALFFSNPQKVKTLFNLTEEEIQYLSYLDQKRVSFFAESLKYKRKNEVSKIIKNTYDILGDHKFKELFFFYCESYNPIGVRKHLIDSIYFLKFIMKQKEIKSNKNIFQIVSNEYTIIKFYNSKYYLNFQKFENKLNIFIKTPFFEIILKQKYFLIFTFHLLILTFYFSLNFLVEII